MSNRRVLLHCNAGGDVGMGHLMRCIGLAQMALDMGWRVAMLGDIDDTGAALVARMASDVELTRVEARDIDQRLLEAIADGVDVVHLDTYEALPEFVAQGVLVSNMQDAAYGARPADLAIDANLGAERRFAHAELSSHQLVGIDAAVVREQVRRQRDVEPAAALRPRVLVVMGGTDPNDLTARIVRALTRIEVPLDVTVISPGRRAEPAAAAAAASAHRIEVVDFVEDLPALARQQDLAISAAGTSVWDFASMGLPMAILCAADNQRDGYREAVDAGLAVGLGLPPHADLDQRVRELAALLSDPRRLQRNRRLLEKIVDGHGAWRIVSAWEQLTAHSAAPSVDTDALAVRRATIDDARLLFEWRNDAATRAGSRSTEQVEWRVHRSWLERSLDDPDRLLLIVQRRDVPVATVRWDHHAGADWEISITIAPAQRGHGLGRAVLAAAEGALPVDQPIRMLAEIHVGNLASGRLFCGAHYLAHIPAGVAGFETRAKWRLPSV